MSIAFDAVSSSGSSFTGNTTFSHTCTGSNLILLVSIVITNASQAVTSITYAGVNLTKAATFTGNGKVEIWYLVNPATGANTVGVNTTAGGGGNFATAESLSLTGVDQTSPIGASGTGTSPSAASIGAALTTTRLNSFIVDSAYSSSSATASLTATGTNQTRRNNILFNASSLVSAQSTIPATAIGSYTSSYSTHSLASNDILALEILQQNVLINQSETIVTVEAADVRGKRFRSFSETIATSDAQSLKKPPKDKAKSSSTWSNQRKS